MVPGRGGGMMSRWRSEQASSTMASPWGGTVWRAPAGLTRPDQVRAGEPDRHRTVARCMPDRGNRSRAGMGAPAGRDARPFVCGAAAFRARDGREASVVAEPQGRSRPLEHRQRPPADGLPGLQPLLTAGIRVRTVMTTAAALSSLARLRRESWTPNALQVFVALEERVTCIALMRSGALIASRDLGGDTSTSSARPCSREAARTSPPGPRARSPISSTRPACGRHQRHLLCGGLPSCAADGAVDRAARRRVRAARFAFRDRCGAAARAGRPVSRAQRRVEAGVGRGGRLSADDGTCSARVTSGRRGSLLARAAVLARVAAVLMFGWRVQSRWSLRPTGEHRERPMARPLPLRVERRRRPPWMRVKVGRRLGRELPQVYRRRLP